MFYNMPECTYKFIVPLICESYQLVKEVLNFIQTKVGRDASPISIAQFQNRRRDGGIPASKLIARESTSLKT